MKNVRAQAAAWREIAGIRALQSRIAEMEVVRADKERETAAQSHVSAEQELDRAQAGWADALEGAFDPGLARNWFGAAERSRAGERQAAEKLGEAEREVKAKRGAWHSAEARGEVADKRRRSAAAADRRSREEARLSEFENIHASRKTKR